MTEGITGLVLAIGFLVLSVVVRRGLNAIHRGLTECSTAFSAWCAASLQQSAGEPSASLQPLSDRLEAVERRVQRPLLNLQTLAGGMLNPPQHPQAVHRPPAQGLEDEGVERPVQQGVRGLGGERHAGRLITMTV